MDATTKEEDTVVIEVIDLTEMTDMGTTEAAKEVATRRNIVSQQESQREGTIDTSMTIGTTTAMRTSITTATTTIGMMITRMITPTEMMT